MEFSSGAKGAALLGAEESIERDGDVGGRDDGGRRVEEEGEFHAFSVLGSFSAAIEEGVPTLGFLSVGLVFGVVVSYVITSSVIPSTVPVTVLWSAASGGVVSVDEGRDLVLPAASNVAVGVWVNLTGLSCEEGLRMGVAADSAAEEPLGRHQSFDAPMNDDVVDFGAQHRRWWQFFAAPPGPGVLSDDLNGVLGAEDTPVCGFGCKPLFLFPLVGRSAVEIECRAKEPAAQIQVVTAVTQRSVSGFSAVPWPALRPKEPFSRRAHVSRAGVGRVEMRLDTVVESTRAAARNHAFSTLSIESDLQCNPHLDSAGDCRTLLRTNTLLLRISTPDITKIHAGYHVGGWSATIASAIGLLSGLLGAATVLIPFAAAVARVCFRNSTTPTLCKSIGIALLLCNALFLLASATLVFLTLHSFQQPLSSNRFDTAFVTWWAIALLTTLPPTTLLLIAPKPKQRYRMHHTLCACAFALGLSTVGVVVWSYISNAPHFPLTNVYMLPPILPYLLATILLTTVSLNSDVNSKPATQRPTPNPKHITTRIGHCLARLLPPKPPHSLQNAHAV